MFGKLVRGSQSKPGDLLLGGDRLVIPLQRKDEESDQLSVRINADGTSCVRTEEELENDFWRVTDIAHFEPTGSYSAEKGTPRGTALGLDADGKWMLGVDMGGGAQAWVGVDGAPINQQARRLIVFPAWRLIIKETPSGEPYVAFTVKQKAKGAPAGAYDAMTGKPKS